MWFWFCERKTTQDKEVHGRGDDKPRKQTNTIDTQLKRSSQDPLQEKVHPLNSGNRPKCASDRMIDARYRSARNLGRFREISTGAIRRRTNASRPSGSVGAIMTYARSGSSGCQPGSRAPQPRASAARSIAPSSRQWRPACRT